MGCDYWRTEQALSGGAPGAPKILGSSGVTHQVQVSASPREGRELPQAWPPGAGRASLSRSLPRVLCGLPPGPSSLSSRCLFQKNFPRRLALSMLGGGAGLGSGSCRNSTAPATLGSPVPGGRWAGRASRGAPRGCWRGASWPPPWRCPLGPGAEAGSPRARGPVGVPAARRILWSLPRPRWRRPGAPRR